MTKHWKLTLLFALIVAILWTWGSNTTAPDQKLVGHLNKICKIAEKGIDSPYSGVRKLFAYYARNTPEMFKQFGELLVTIEHIKDDKAHDARAALAGRRLHKAVASCERTYERFGLAIEADPKASALVESGVLRLSRTLELLFGGGRGTGFSALVPGLHPLRLPLSK